MPTTRFVPHLRRYAVAVLCGAVVLFAGACKRPAPPPPAPKPAPAAPTPSKTPEQSADDNWMKLRKQIKNVDARVEEAISKLQQAQKIKAERWEGKPDGDEKKAAFKEIRQLMGDAGDIMDMLRDDSEKLSKDLWVQAFKVDERRYETAHKAVKKGLPRL